MSDIEVSNFLEHFGVKGMRWGRRKSDSTGDRPLSKRKQRKAFKEAAVKEFRSAVLKDVGSRPMNELYAVRGKSGPTMIMTGQEFVEKAGLGMPFTSLQSTGLKINDGTG